MAARIFFSYSHDDEEQRNQLDKHLAFTRQASDPRGRRHR